MCLNRVVLLCTLVVSWTAVAYVNGERCNRVGIIASEKSKDFQICSKGEDGSLTLKTLTCGEDSYFSLEQKGCVPAQTESENTVEEDVNVAMKSLSNGSLMHRYCPLTKGKLCASCNTAVSCISRSVVAVTQCPPNWSCDNYMSTCVNKTLPECSSDYKFYCNNFGIYPDPYYCSRFYVCERAGRTPYSFSCPYNEVFNTTTAECEYNSQNTYFSSEERCTRFPKCLEDLQVGPVPGNARMYYACLDDNQGGLRYALFRCNSNYVFDGESCKYQYYS